LLDGVDLAGDGEELEGDGGGGLVFHDFSSKRSVASPAKVPATYSRKLLRPSPSKSPSR
jgi:hypothetical protein